MSKKSLGSFKYNVYYGTPYEHRQNPARSFFNDMLERMWELHAADEAFTMDVFCNRYYAHYRAEYLKSCLKNKRSKLFNGKRKDAQEWLLRLRMLRLYMKHMQGRAEINVARWKREHDQNVA